MDLWAYDLGKTGFRKAIHRIPQEWIQEFQEFDGGLYLSGPDHTGEWANIHVYRDGVWHQRNIGRNFEIGEHVYDVKRFQGKLFTVASLNDHPFRNHAGIRISDDDGVTWRWATGGPPAHSSPFRFLIFRGELWAVTHYSRSSDSGNVSELVSLIYKYTPGGPTDFQLVYSTPEEAGLQVLGTYNFNGQTITAYRGFETSMMFAREIERPDGLYLLGANRLWRITQMEPQVVVQSVALPGVTYAPTGTIFINHFLRGLRWREGRMLVMVNDRITPGSVHSSWRARLLQSTNGTTWTEVARFAVPENQRAESFEWRGGDLYVGLGYGGWTSLNGSLFRVRKEYLQGLPDLEPETEWVTMAPGADAHTFRQSPNTNYGSNTTLRVCGGWNERNAYLKFNPEVRGQVIEAKLRVYGGRVSGSGNVGVRLLGRADTGWQESTLTWNTATAPGGTDLGTRQVNAAAWHEWDITQYLENWEMSGSTHPLEFLLTTTATAELSVNSRDHAANRPELIIRWLPGTGSPGNPGNPGNPGDPGNPGNPGNPGIVLSQEVATADAHTFKQGPSTNY
ncbi:MAG: DNRLRE domain-containing protein, partial [Verrucomicrobiia bacterium]